MVKNPPAVHETQLQSLGQRILWRRKWQPAPVFLPEKSHGPGRLQSIGSQRVGHDSELNSEQLSACSKGCQYMAVAIFVTPP